MALLDRRARRLRVAPNAAVRPFRVASVRRAADRRLLDGRDDRRLRSRPGDRDASLSRRLLHARRGAVPHVGGVAAAAGRDVSPSPRGACNARAGDRAVRAADRAGAAGGRIAARVRARGVLLRGVRLGDRRRRTAARNAARRSARRGAARRCRADRRSDRPAPRRRAARRRRADAVRRRAAARGVAPRRSALRVDRRGSRGRWSRRWRSPLRRAPRSLRSPAIGIRSSTRSRSRTSSRARGAAHAVPAGTRRARPASRRRRAARAAESSQGRSHFSGPTQSGLRAARRLRSWRCSVRSRSRAASRSR